MQNHSAATDFAILKALIKFSLCLLIKINFERMGIQHMDCSKIFQFESDKICITFFKKYTYLERNNFNLQSCYLNRARFHYFYDFSCNFSCNAYERDAKNYFYVKLELLQLMREKQKKT